MVKRGQRVAAGQGSLSSRGSKHHNGAGRTRMSGFQPEACGQVRVQVSMISWSPSKSLLTGVKNDLMNRKYQGIPHIPQTKSRGGEN